MEPAIDPFARQYVRAKVRQLLRHARTVGVEADQLTADLLLNLVRRRSRFDPTRSRWTTFVRLVTDHAVADLLERWARMGPLLQATISLSALHGNGDSPETGDDTLAQDANDRRRGRHRRPAQVEWEFAFDVRESVNDLSPRLRQLCEALLQEDSAAEARRSLGLTPRQFKRRVREVARQFQRRDLHRYLPKLRSGPSAPPVS